jgi:hypothetical protein
LEIRFADVRGTLNFQLTAANCFRVCGSADAAAADNGATTPRLIVISMDK